MKLTRRQFVARSSMAALLPRRGWAQTAPAPGAAMDALSAAIPKAQTDPDRPIYHFRPPANWNNDPNGTIFYRGWHHLFYQLNPSAPRGGNQHWGHARSRDLVNWEHLPIALWPLTDRGERAIFSGGATLGPDGRPRIFYTSIGHPSPEQWIALPQDDELFRWERPDVNPILTIDSHGSTNVAQWRDPFLFVEDGQTYMVCGGNLNNGRGGGGSVQLYRATSGDLTKWKFLGVIFQYRDLRIYNVECPNLFRLGDKWVLLMSPQQPCEYFIGQLDLGRLRFVPDVHGILDPGSAYASNISVDDHGRTILWLWGRTNTPADKGWNGCMTLPRVLSIGGDGFLRQLPAPEFETLRGSAVSEGTLELTPGEPTALRRIQGDAIELKADVVPGSAAEVAFELRRSSDGKAGVTVRITRTGLLSVGTAQIQVSRALERYTLRIFLDRRVVEVYVNDGEAAVFGTVDAGDDTGVAITAQATQGRGVGPAPGGRGQAAPVNARVESLQAWPMKAARFSLEHFHL
jgi:beta-fructofuranosidase